MNKVNICGLTDITDQHHRYKMSRLDVTFEKNKTIIQNLDTIASSLNRPTEMIIFFFKKHFNSSFTFKDGKYSTTKKILPKEFHDALKEFIEYIVLCPKCKLPETQLTITKNITINCICCGHTDKINSSTMQSKPLKDLISHLTK